MKQETQELIKEIARFIDKDKYNPILVSRDYNKYLEKILTELVNSAISFELSAINKEGKK